MSSGMDEADRMVLRAKDAQWVEDVTQLCNALREINPRFDAEIFTDWIQSKGRVKYIKK